MDAQRSRFHSGQILARTYLDLRRWVDRACVAVALSRTCAVVKHGERGSGGSVRGFDLKLPHAHLPLGRVEGGLHRGQLRG